MSTRIRYMKKDHMLVTNDTFFGTEGILVAEIDVNTNSYKVYSVDGETSERKVLHSGTSKTLHMVKKHVKETLKGFGVQFNEEGRKKKVHEGSSSPVTGQERE